MTSKRTSPNVLAIFMNPINGEAITATQNGMLMKWIDTGGQPTESVTRKMDEHGLGWINDLNFAVSPDGDMFFNAPPRGESILTCRWSDLAFLSRMTYSDEEITTIAASPDGRWLAVGMIESPRLKGLLLVDRETREAAASIWAGEAIESVRFDGTSRVLAATCFTGCDTYVRVYKIGATGALSQICEGLPNDWGPHKPPFRIIVSSVAVNGEQNLIAVFAIWTTSPSDESVGKRATCTVCDLTTGERIWMRAFDPEVTNDLRSFQETLWVYDPKEDIVFLNSPELICNVSDDALIVLNVFTGEETRRIPLGHNRGVRSFALDRRRKRLWTVSAQSELHVYDV